MEFKGTKGKWIIKKDNTIVSEKNQGCLVAQICSANNNEVEQQANAKLIASAPEILKELIDDVNELRYLARARGLSEAELLSLNRKEALIKQATEQ